METINTLIIAAMDEEETAVLNALSHIPSKRIKLSDPFDLTFTKFESNAKSLSVLKCGMGQVNAALALALFAEKQPVDAVILLGVGGALAPELEIGELVISRAVIQHDYFASLDFGNPRMLPGHIVFSPEEARKHSAVFTANPEILNMSALIDAGLKVQAGTVLSGNEFVGTTRRKEEIAGLHEEALLVDMEAAGVAQVSTRLGIPFVVAKTVADRLLPDGSIESDFRKCLEAAARNSAVVAGVVLGRE